MAIYDLREGPATAAGRAYAKLTTVGPETRNAIVVPPGMHSIKEITTSSHFDALDASGGVIAVKLDGLAFGSYETAMAGFTAGTEAGDGGDARYCRPTTLKTNLAVTPGAEIWVSAAVMGITTFPTASEAVVELAFDSGQGEKRYGVIRMNFACPTVATKYAANSDATTDTAYGIKIPSDAKHITNIVPICSGITVATAAGGCAFARLEGGLPDGDFGLTLGGCSTYVATAGLSGAGYFEPDIIPCDIKVSPGGYIQVYVESTGTTWQTPFLGVAIEMGV